MAKLPEEGYVVSIGTEGYWVSDGFAELLIQLLQYGDTSNVILTTKTAIQDEKMKLLSDIHSLSIEKEKLKEELEFVRGDNTKFEEDVKQLKNDLEESQRNNMELAADVKALEIRLQEANKKLVNAEYGLGRMTLDALLKENEKLKEKLSIAKDLRKEVERDWCELNNTCKELVKERDNLKKQNEYLSGSIEKICDIHAKEKAELKEQLTASSDLNMTNELVNIFAEYTVVDQKNRDDLGDKITEFRRKYGLE